MSQLMTIDVVFPEVAGTFFKDLTIYLRDLGDWHEQSLTFRTTKSSYCPLISLKENGVAQPLVRFGMDDGELHEVILENTTGVEKRSRYAYSAITERCELKPNLVYKWQKY